MIGISEIQGRGSGLSGHVVQKLPKQEEILLGEDLKDLGLPGVLEQKIIVVGCHAETNLLNSHVLIL